MIAWAIETVVATTLLMLLVLAIRNPVRRSFGPGVAYALWSLPVLRMLLPPLPEEVRGGAEPMLSIVPEDIVISLGHPVATLPLEPAAGLGWPVWAAIVWLAGVIAFLGYHLIAHSRFCARLRARARVVTSVAAGRVTMIESDTASGPLASASGTNTSPFRPTSPSATTIWSATWRWRTSWAITRAATCSPTGSRW